MPFESLDEASRTVRDSGRLTVGEIRDLKPWLPQMGAALNIIFEAELAALTIEAIEKFDRSSSRLTRGVLWLTVVLVALTVILAIPEFKDFWHWLNPIFSQH